MVTKQSPALTAYSRAKLNGKLGHFDQLAVMVLVDNLNNNTDGFDLWMAHSADDRIWLYTANGSLTRPTTGNVHWDVAAGAAPLLTTDTNIGTYLFAGAPLFDFVRFEMAFSSTNTGGHIRVYVTQRDQGA